MNKILLSLATSLFLLQAHGQNGLQTHGQNGAQAPNAHQIRLSLKPYTSGKVYLGYYYGKIKALADSTMLDVNSAGSFTGKDPLPGGVYFIVSPNRTILFELLIY